MDDSYDASNTSELEFPRIRFKRSHTKSRSGCITCKRRRVKCDETRPRCNRCRDRRIECVYRKGSEARSVAKEAKPQIIPCERSPHSSPSRSQSESSGLSIPGLSDKDLMKVYLQDTVQAFEGTGLSPEQLYTWKILIPAIAYTSNEVRRGMLTLAAVHSYYQASHDSQWASDCLDTAESLGEGFVRDSRKQLVELNPLKVDAGMACTRLLCVLGFAFYGIHRRNGITLADSAAWTWLQLLRGVKTIHDSIVEAGHNIDPAFKKDMESAKTPLDGDRNRTVPECKVEQLAFIQTSRHQRFEALTATLNQIWPDTDKEGLYAMLEAIEILQKVTQDILSAPEGSLFRLICAWPSLVPETFIKNLKYGAAFALVIYAHWLMLVVLVDDLWWVNDMGRAGIRNVVEQCSTADPSIRALLSWPKQMLDMHDLVSGQDI